MKKAKRRRSSYVYFIVIALHMLLFIYGPFCLRKKEKMSQAHLASVGSAKRWAILNAAQAASINTLANIFDKRVTLPIHVVLPGISKQQHEAFGKLLYLKLVKTISESNNIEGPFCLLR